MSAFSEKPGLREQMITALAGSQMTPVEGRECSLDRIAAFGAAQIAVTTGGFDQAALHDTAAALDTLEARRVTDGYASFSIDAPVDVERVREVTIDPLARFALNFGAPAAFPIEPELAALLLRLKYFPEASTSMYAAAVETFAGVIWRDMRRRRDRNRKEPRELLAKVAQQAIAEWIAGACPTCKGVGRTGATTGGVRERLVRCRTCDRVPGPKHALRDLTEEEKLACPGYAKFEVTSRGVGAHEYGRYWTKDELDRIGMPSGRMHAVLPELGLTAWISCIACCGRGTVIDRKRIRGRAGDACGRCAGLGHFLPSDVERAAAIDVSENTYRARWKVTFDAALRAARALDRRMIESLRAQLGRSAPASKSGSNVA